MATLKSTFNFTGNSIATACVIMYWIDDSNSYGLVNFGTSKLNRNEGVARGIIDVGNQEGESRGYHVAVAYSNNMISGEALNKYMLVLEREQV